MLDAILFFAFGVIVGIVALAKYSMWKVAQETKRNPEAVQQRIDELEVKEGSSE